MHETVVETRKGPITLEEALDRETDVIPTLFELEPYFDFRDGLSLLRPQIEEVISRHLGISTSRFRLSDVSEWISGGFNFCLPIYIDNARKNGLPPRAIIRFARPFNCGEDFRPGSVDEKVRCEAASYIWLKENCPSVPTPRLLGMGFPGTQSFTAIENETLYNRFIWLFRYGLAWWQGDTLTSYFAHHRAVLPDHGYLLIEHVEEGKMLSNSWKEHRHDGNRRSNLYRGLAKVMLDLAHVPLPRIGSWTLNDQGILSLTNRPVSDLTFFWDRHRIPTGVPRTMTYTSTEPFIHDTLTYQDLRMRHQLNSILSKQDGIFQLSALTALRALLPKFFPQVSRNGPFIFTFNDLHQSNIFVDDQWNLTRIIDLEFASVRPLHMSCVPSWLSDRGVDQLRPGPHLEEYTALYNHFVLMVEEEEKTRKLSHMYSQSLREGWECGRIWYNNALNSLNAFPAIWEDHLQPRFFEKFDSEREGLALARLWDGKDVEEFIEGKVTGDLKRYQEGVERVFEAVGKGELATEGVRKRIFEE